MDERDFENGVAKMCEDLEDPIAAVQQEGYCLHSLRKAADAE